MILTQCHGFCFLTLHFYILFLWLYLHVMGFSDATSYWKHKTSLICRLERKPKPDQLYKLSLYLLAFFIKSFSRIIDSNRFVWWCLFVFYISELYVFSFYITFRPLRQVKQSGHQCSFWKDDANDVRAPSDRVSLFSSTDNSTRMIAYESCCRIK